MLCALEQACVALVMTALIQLQAEAACLSHNPLDIQHCSMRDFSAPIGTYQWYMQNDMDRRATMIQCHSQFPPPQSWCNAASQANLALGQK